MIDETRDREDISQIIARHASRPGPLMPILHDLQHQFGYVPESAISMIADALNLSRAEVWGTFTFYHDFREAPAGKRVLKLCRSEACQAVGGDRLAARAERHLGISCGETTGDGRATLEAIYCLGLCHSAPAAMLGDKLHALLDEPKLDALLEELES